MQTVTGADSLGGEIARLKPSEILTPRELGELDGTGQNVRDGLAFDVDLGFRFLCGHSIPATCAVSASDARDPAIGAAAAVLQYAQASQCRKLEFVDRIGGVRRTTTCGSTRTAAATWRSTAAPTAARRPRCLR